MTGASRQIELPPERSGQLNQERLGEKPSHGPGNGGFQRIGRLIAAGSPTILEPSINAASKPAAVVSSTLTNAQPHRGVGVLGGAQGTVGHGAMI